MAKCVAESNLGTAADTYLYTLARNGATFAAIGSDDSLRLFDISLRALSTAVPANSGISCLARFAGGFATAGRDGIIQTWDTRAKKAGVEIPEPRGNGVSSIAVQDHFVAAGTESAKEGLGDVSVLLYDTRNASAPIRSYTESHTDTITQLAFHPSQPNVLLSGSTDGLVSIFDINQSDEEDALQQVLNPRSAVHCTGFLSPTEVYVVTTDEHFSIYSLAATNDSDSTRSATRLGDVREKLHCMYVVTVINGSQPVMAVGHNIDQTLSILQLDSARSYGFGPVIDLIGAHGEEVVRDLMVLDREEKAISCGEDGHVKVWDLSKAVARSGDAMDVDRGT